MQLIQTFKAKDSQGRSFTLQVWQELIDASSREGHDVIPGMKQLTTSDGHAVNLISKGKYEIVWSGQIVTSDDPNAPGESD